MWEVRAAQPKAVHVVKCNLVWTPIQNTIMSYLSMLFELEPLLCT